MWYEEWFNSEAYEVVYRERDLDDARRMVDLVERAARLRPAARLLDVACGRGRHARLLAARGYHVTGVDLSPNAITTARKRAEQEGVTVDFRTGDMRSLPFEAEFDGVVNLFTSFGYFEDDEEHEQAIEQMARALTPGGFLVQDFLNREFAVSQIVSEDERTLQADGLGELTLRQKRWVSDHEGRQRIEKRIELCCFDHPEGEPDTFVFQESVRLFTLTDFRRMYDKAGLRLEETFGDYDGRPHGPDARRLILLARRDY